MLSELGAEIVDADREAHRVLERPEVRDVLQEWWGPQIFAADGSPDRRQIAQRVFDDPEELRRLEALLHPPVHEVIEQRVEAFRQHAREPESTLAGRRVTPMLVLDVPLLGRSPALASCDAVVFVDADEEVRLRRVHHRGWTAEQFRRREAAQLPIDEKRRLAQHTVDNSGSLAATRRQVRELYGELVKTD